MRGRNFPHVRKRRILTTSQTVHFPPRIQRLISSPLNGSSFKPSDWSSQSRGHAVTGDCTGGQRVSWHQEHEVACGRQRHMYFCAEIVPKRSFARMGPMGGILCFFNSIVLSDKRAVYIFTKLWTEYLCDFINTKKDRIKHTIDMEDIQY